MSRRILFSALMIRALLDGRKTQTRRLIKPAPYVDQMGNFCTPARNGGIWNWGQHLDGRPCTRNFMSERIRFAIGDRLWVREAWQDVAEGYLTIYRADYPACVPSHFENVPTLADLKTPWRPSIFMPRAASRLTLVVTDVRVERLQDISEADAKAEGVDPIGVESGAYDGNGNQIKVGSYVAAYAEIWNTINGPGSWDANPWVVAVSFTVHRGNIDRMGSA